jgi:hypothetical protein
LRISPSAILTFILYVIRSLKQKGLILFIRTKPFLTDFSDPHSVISIKLPVTSMLCNPGSANGLFTLLFRGYWPFNGTRIIFKPFGTDILHLAE